MGTGQLEHKSSRGFARQLEGTCVLTYHGLTIDSPPSVLRREQKYWINALRFQEHIEFLHREHHQVITLSEFWSAPRAERDAVVLTFDDGRVTDYEIAFPRLLEAGLRATFFVNTATIGTSGYLTWAHIDEMHRFGMSLQSHGHDHLYLSRLSKLEVQEQLATPKRLLEDRLGTAVCFLAAPNGDMSDSVAELALKTGYRAICTSRNWPARPGCMFIDRVVIYDTTTIKDLRGLVDRNPLVYRARMARTALLYLPKKLYAFVRGSRG